MFRDEIFERKNQNISQKSSSRAQSENQEFNELTQQNFHILMSF